LWHHSPANKQLKGILFGSAAKVTEIIRCEFQTTSAHNKILPDFYFLLPKAIPACWNSSTFEDWTASDCAVHCL